MTLQWYFVRARSACCASRSPVLHRDEHYEKQARGSLTAARKLKSSPLGRARGALGVSCYPSRFSQLLRLVSAARRGLRGRSIAAKNMSKTIANSCSRRYFFFVHGGLLEVGPDKFTRPVAINAFSRWRRAPSVALYIRATTDSINRAEAALRVSASVRLTNGYIRSDMPRESGARAIASRAADGDA